MNTTQNPNPIHNGECCICDAPATQEIDDLDFCDECADREKFQRRHGYADWTVEAPKQT